jgi:hypothetical protein
MSDAPIQLPTDLYSPDQLGAVILELRSYLSLLRDTSVRAHLAQAEAGAPHASALLLGVLRSTNIELTDQLKIEKALKELEVIRSKAPAAHLMMAALPNRDLKRKLIDWFRTEIHPYMLLTFATRTDIGGGVVIQAGSHIYNYSFRQQILSHKGRISEIFNSVRQ